MTTVTLVVFGILLGLTMAATGMVMYFLLRQLARTADRVDKAILALQEAAKTFAQSASMGDGIMSLIAVQRRNISALESMSAAIKTFNSLVLKEESMPPEPPPAYTGWRPGGPPPPPNPAFDENAPAADAGYMEQSEEVLAEIERQNELREQGIETDPLRIKMPPPEQMYGG